MPFDASPTLTTEALDAIALLTRARAILDKHDWVQKSFYRIGRAYAGGTGREITAAEISAVCAEGAVCLAQQHDEVNFSEIRISQMINSLAYRALQQTVHVGRGRVASWNDKIGRGKDEVLAAFDDASNLLRSGWLPS